MKYENYMRSDKVYCPRKKARGKLGRYALEKYKKEINSKFPSKFDLLSNPTLSIETARKNKGVTLSKWKNVEESEIDLHIINERRKAGLGQITIGSLPPPSHDLKEIIEIHERKFNSSPKSQHKTSIKQFLSENSKITPSFSSTGKIINVEKHTKNKTKNMHKGHGSKTEDDPYGWLSRIPQRAKSPQHRKFNKSLFNFFPKREENEKGNLNIQPNNRTSPNKSKNNEENISKIESSILPSIQIPPNNALTLDVAKEEKLKIKLLTDKFFKRSNIPVSPILPKKKHNFPISCRNSPLLKNLKKKNPGGVNSESKEAHKKLQKQQSRGRNIKGFHSMISPKEYSEKLTGKYSDKYTINDVDPFIASSNTLSHKILSPITARIERGNTVSTNTMKYSPDKNSRELFSTIYHRRAQSMEFPILKTFSTPLKEKDPRYVGKKSIDIPNIQRINEFIQQCRIANSSNLNIDSKLVNSQSLSENLEQLEAMKKPAQANE